MKWKPVSKDRFSVGYTTRMIIPYPDVWVNISHVIDNYIGILETKSL